MMHVIDGHNIVQIWIFTISFKNIQHTASRVIWQNEMYDFKVCSLSLLYMCLLFLLQGDRIHQAAADTVPEVVLLLLGLLHPFLS